MREAAEEDHEAAAEALALAFADDPAWAHLIPDDAGRAERLLAFFNAEIANLVPEWRRLWVTGDGSGAAIWAPPGRWRVPFSRTLRRLHRDDPGLRRPAAGGDLDPAADRAPPSDRPRGTGTCTIWGWSRGARDGASAGR